MANRLAGLSWGPEGCLLSVILSFFIRSPTVPTKHFMMMSIRVYGLVAMLCLWGSLVALPLAAQVQPPGIGDTMPNVEVTVYLKGKEWRGALSSLAAGRPVVIDFWATYCSNCIAKLPAYSRLQQAMQDSVLILAVTHETREKAVGVLQRRLPGLDVGLAMVYNDTLLRQLFPHLLLSHIVWLDRHRVVRGITGADYVHAAHIRQVAAGEKIAWPVKADLCLFNKQQPIMRWNNAAGYNLPLQEVEQVLWLPHLSGVDAGTKRDSVDGLYRITTVNRTVPLMYALVLGRLPAFRNLYRYASGVDTLLWKPDHVYQDVWDKANTFCLEYRVPARWGADSIRRHLRKHLKLRFGLDMRYDSVAVATWVVRGDGGQVPVEQLEELAYQWNTDSPVPIVVESATPKALHAVPTVADFQNAERFSAWCARYGMQVTVKNVLHELLLVNRLPATD